MKTLTKPGKKGREVFVQYNLDDPLVTFLSYGFVDQSAPFIYSVPVKLTTLSGLEIFVSSSTRAPAIQKSLPEGLKSMANYIPKQYVRRDLQVMTNMLIIPRPEKEHLLSAAISYTLTRFDPEGIYTDADRLKLEVANLRKQLLDKNVEFWQNLRGFVDEFTTKNKVKEDVKSQLLQLCEVNDLHLANFVSRTGHLLST